MPPSDSRAPDGQPAGRPAPQGTPGTTIVACSPGALDLADQPDEYTGVDDMVDAATVMGPGLVDLPGAWDEGGG